MADATSCDQAKRTYAFNLLHHDLVLPCASSPTRFKGGFLSPMYVQMRGLGEWPALRGMLTLGLYTELKSLLSQHYCSSDNFVIASVAMGALPVGSMLAQLSNGRHAYVRHDTKGHGLANRVEGASVKDRPVVVFEDVVTLGDSSGRDVEVLKAAGGNIIGVLSIFTYDFSEAERRFKELGVRHHSLVNFRALRQAMQRPELSTHWTTGVLRVVDEWYGDPDAWTKKMEAQQSLPV